jgi:phage terminase small subunit
MKPLNRRQARFVAEYLIDLNASAAAVRAGYKARSAHNVSYVLMKRPAVAAAIAEGQRDLISKVDLSAERVLRQTMRIAFADIGKLYNADGTLKDMPEVDADTRAAVASVDVVERNASRVRRLRMRDPMPALMLLGRHLNLWHDPREGPLNGREIAEAMAEARERAP